jgi:hypothetical protein
MRSFWLAAFTIAGCHRATSGISRVPPGQEKVLANIAANTSDKVPPRRGGVMMPQETGRQIRAQAVRPPTPGPYVPPPAGT